MAAEGRSLSRLPLHIFKGLSFETQQEISNETWHDNTTIVSAEALRSKICAKLMRFQLGRKRRFNSHIDKFTRPSADSLSVQTVDQMLTLSPFSLLKALSPLLTFEECEMLRQRILKECSAESVDAFTMLQGASSNQNKGGIHHQKRSRGCISSGMRKFDQCLRGGIALSGITEVVGRAGVGKTQFAMQCCIMAAKEGMGSIYIDTERKISLKRLEQLAFERYRMNIGHGEELYKNPSTVLQNVTLHSPANSHELLVRIGQLEEEIVIRNSEVTNRANSDLPNLSLGLIVVDSIAAPTQRDFGPGEALQRMKVIFKIAQTLKRLSHDHGVAVIVINQVGVPGSARANTVENSFVADGNLESETAALGITWHHCVTTRVRLEQGVSDVRTLSLNEEPAGLDIRRATIEKSNVTRKSGIVFKIADAGLVEEQY